MTLLRIITLFCLFQIVAVTQTAARTILNVGYLPELSHLPLVVAYEKGYLAFRHCNVQLHKFNTYTSLEAALKTGYIDIAYMPLATTINLVSQGAPFEIGRSLHRGGFYYFHRKNALLTKPEIYGVPGISSAEHLLLYTLLSKQGKQYGTDYKVATIDVDLGVAELNNKRVDTLLVPSPYAGLYLSSVADRQKYVMKPLESLPEPTHSLIFHKKFMTEGLKPALDEYLHYIYQACIAVEEDTSLYNGAQTAITQQDYFGYDVALMASLAVSENKYITYDVKEISSAVIERTKRNMVTLGLLFENL